MIIGVCGFGSTGSSAVSDYLCEYGEDLCVLDSLEFTWVCDTDGIIDLEYHVMKPHNRTNDSIIAIQRFKNKAHNDMRKYVIGGKIPKETYYKSIDEFIESITNVTWNWYDFTKTGLIAKYLDKYLLRNRIIPRIERKLHHQINVYPMVPVNLSVKPEHFYQAARKQVKCFIEAMGGDYTKPIVLDQPFSGNNPQACFPYYEDPYAIIVDRDPRDNYVFSKTRLVGKNHFMANEKVEDFVKYYRAIRDNQPYKSPNERVLRIQFEDMVYEYEITSKKIQEFLNLPDNPRSKTIFVPEMSRANTQVWKRFPEYAEDIEYIEKELKEYLFDFGKYGEIDIAGEMFFGKSPLHK